MSLISRPTLIDPAGAVAALLTRMAFFFLAVIVPLLGSFSRRTTAVIVPLAVVLIILGAMLEGRLGGAARRWLRLVTSPPGLACAALLAWAGLSLLWTPAFAPAVERLLTVTGTLGLVLFAITCLPERSKSSDVYLIPIGIGATAIAVAMQTLFGPRLGFSPPTDGEGLVLERAVIMMTLLVWPAFTFLLMKQRPFAAGLLVAVATVGIVFSTSAIAVAAFLVASMVFGLARRAPHAVTLAVAAAGLAGFLIAPAAGYFAGELTTLGLSGEAAATLGVWKSVVVTVPQRLIAGFGLEASRMLGPEGGPPLLSARNAFLQIWLELGLIGAILSAAALCLGGLAIGRLPAHIRPAALAVHATALIAVFLGLAAWQIWWITLIGLVAIGIGFTARGVGRSLPR